MISAARRLSKPVVAPPDGRVLIELRKPWRDGTTHLRLEPLELLEKLAALTPRPEAHLLLYHGMLAPHAAWRQRVVDFGRPPGDVAGAEAPSGQPGAGSWPRSQAGAVLMQRAFGLDVLACPRCGGRLRLIATISDPPVIDQILTHLGLAPAREPAGPVSPTTTAVIAPS